MQKVFALALVIAIFATTAFAFSRVRTTLKHNAIPKAMLWASVGGNAQPWRIYELNGRYQTWMSDTGSFATGGGFACGLEKLQIDQGSSKFTALEDYDETIVDYYTNNPDAITQNPAAIQQVWKDCLAKYQTKEAFVQASGFNLIVSSSVTVVTTVDSSCANKISSSCAISPFNFPCDSNKQCGGGIIKCKSGICNSATKINVTIAALLAVIATAFIGVY